MVADSITQNHRIILVTLGGASSSNSEDGILSLANDFSGYPEVLKIYGTPLPHGKDYQAETIAEKIDELYDQIHSNNPHLIPIIILIGKSMGGCILHKVSQKLNSEIQLFIGVDMSCTISCHYKKYNEGDEDQAKIFDGGKVKKLINFFQLVGDQCGHPAIYAGSSDLNEISVNIDVNKYNYDMDNQVIADRDVIRGLVCNSVEIIGEPDFYSSRINDENKRVDTYGIRFRYWTTFNNIYDLCNNANHTTIDTCSELLTVIRRLIREVAYLPFDDEREYPKYSINYSVPPAEDPINIISNCQLEQEDGEEVISIRFEVGPSATESYERKVLINLTPNNLEDSILISLRKPFICMAPYMGEQPPFSDCLDRISGVEETEIAIPENETPPSDAEITEIREEQSDRIIYVATEGAMYPNDMLDPVTAWDVAAAVGIPPHVVEEYLLGAIMDESTSYSYKWGYVKVPIYCKLTEHNFPQTSTGQISRTLKVEEYINGGDTFDGSRQENIPDDEINRYKIFDGFEEQDYVDDRVLKCTLTVQDSAEQKATTTLYFYAKSLLRFRDQKFISLISKYDEEDKKGVLFDEIKPHFTKNIIKTLGADRKAKVNKDLNKFKKEISNFVTFSLGELKNDKIVKMRLNEEYQKECSRVINICNKRGKIFSNKDEFRKMCVTTRLNGILLFMEKGTSLIQEELIKNLKEKGNIERIIASLDSKKDFNIRTR